MLFEDMEQLDLAVDCGQLFSEEDVQFILMMGYICINKRRYMKNKSELNYQTPSSLTRWSHYFFLFFICTLHELFVHLSQTLELQKALTQLAYILLFLQSYQY